MEVFGIILLFLAIFALYAFCFKIRFDREELHHKWKLEEIEAAKKKDSNSDAKDINVTKINL